MSEVSSVPRDELVAYLSELLEARPHPRSESERTPGRGCATVDGSSPVCQPVASSSSTPPRFRPRRCSSITASSGAVIPRELTGFRRQRVAELLAADINLIAYHLPLDRHAELGNNALAARRLGLEEIRTFGQLRRCADRLQRALPHPGRRPTQLAELCANRLRPATADLRRGEAPHLDTSASSAAPRSGSSTPPIDGGLDAFITGEVSEWVVNVARETGTVYVAAGHYATERLGIRGSRRAHRRTFGSSVEFFDVPNPV